MCEFSNDRNYINNEEEICLLDKDIHFTGMNIKYTDYMILIVGDDYNNIDIYVNGNFSGRFYRRSVFTEIIIKIFANKDFKILFYLLDGYENEYDQLIKFKIYTNKNYFMNNYKSVLLKLFYNFSPYSSIVKIPEHINIENEMIDEDYMNKHKLFVHQMININWMQSIEEKIRTQTNYLTTIDRENAKFHVKELNKTVYYNYNKVYDFNPSGLKKVYINGGILSEKVGNGKTRCCCHLASKDMRQKNLIVVPKRLVNQWMDEFKTIDITPVKVVCKRSYDKEMKKDNPFNKKIYITTYTFLIHKLHKDNRSFFSKKWKRIFFDELQDFYSNNSKNRKTLDACLDLKTDIKWVVSAELFNNYNNLNKTIQFFTKKSDFNVRYLSRNDMLYDKFMDIFMKKHRDDDIQKYMEVKIPEPKLNNVFIEMNELEKSIYNMEYKIYDQNKHAYLKNEIFLNLIQICANPKYSAFYNKFLKSSEEIDIKTLTSNITQYIQKNLPKIEKKITELEYILEVSTEMNKYDKIKYDFKEEKEEINKLKAEKGQLNYRKDLMDKLNDTKQENECCICLSEFSDFILTDCYHYICVDCYQELLKHSSTPKCPSCRQNITKKRKVTIEKKVMSEEEKFCLKWGSKLVYLKKLVTDILTKNNTDKIIIFSRWKEMIKDINKMFEINTLFLKGGIGQCNNILKKFKTNNDFNVLLLCSEDSASGLNLTEATHVILLDTPDLDKIVSKSIENQAIGRAVRFGQTKHVNVYKMIMKNTIEENFI